jgi:threonyl-tRNA synthetase
MIQITLPDGAVREYEAGINAGEIARSISEGLARKVLAAEVNGEVWDTARPINDNATLKLLTWDDKNAKSTFWHSSAHLMAEALEVLYPGVKLGIGPAIETGFYYDVDLGGRSVGEEDLKKIEDKMKNNRNDKGHSKINPRSEDAEVFLVSLLK